MARRSPPGLSAARQALRGRALTALLLVAGLALSLACPSTLRAQAQGEAALKARLTLSMTRFVQWPGGGPGDTLRLCLAQRDAHILQAFANADGQVVNGRRIQLSKVPPLGACHVLFVHASAERPAELIRQLGQQPVLVVGDVEGTLNLGGMVEMVTVDDAVRFDVNQASLRHAQLSISSQVLKLARQVRE